MLEQALIDYCSPTLAHLKTGSLFTLPCADQACLNGQVAALTGQLAHKGLVLTVLRFRRGRALLYLYRTAALAASLGDGATRSFLSACGYTDFGVAAVLDTLRARLAAREDFPHEIGVFLGYPLSDVIAFIENEGQNCLCCGCWKVYSNECAARRTFEQYRKCKRVYLRRFREGCPLSRLAVATHRATA